MVEGKQGVLNFEGHRSITKFLDVAKEVGLLVIVRPGPYVPSSVFTPYELTFMQIY